MGVCIICTLGNRDIQFDVDDIEELIKEIISNEEELKNLLAEKKPKFNKSHHSNSAKNLREIVYYLSCTLTHKNKYYILYQPLNDTIM